MATDERFVLVPNGGFNPDVETVRMVGISGNNGTHRICCSIEDQSFQVAPVYFCKSEGATYGVYFSPYNTEHISFRMTVCSAVNGVGRETINTKLIFDLATVLYWRADSSQYMVDTNVVPFDSIREAGEAFMNMLPDEYVNIQYVGNGCLVTGPSYTMQGTGVAAPVTLPIGASLTSDNITVTKNGTAIDFSYNPQTQMIAFTAI